MASQIEEPPVRRVPRGGAVAGTPPVAPTEPVPDLKGLRETASPAREAAVAPVEDVPAPVEKAPPPVEKAPPPVEKAPPPVEKAPPPVEARSPRASATDPAGPTRRARATDPSDATDRPGATAGSPGPPPPEVRTDRRARRQLRGRQRGVDFRTSGGAQAPGCSRAANAQSRLGPRRRLRPDPAQLARPGLSPGELGATGRPIARREAPAPRPGRRGRRCGDHRSHRPAERGLELRPSRRQGLRSPCRPRGSHARTAGRALGGAPAPTNLDLSDRPPQGHRQAG